MTIYDLKLHESMRVSYKPHNDDPDTYYMIVIRVVRGWIYQIGQHSHFVKEPLVYIPEKEA